MSIFSERISFLMKKDKITQKQLSGIVGVTGSAISYYVKSERTP